MNQDGARVNYLLEINERNPVRVCPSGCAYLGNTISTEKIGPRPQQSLMIQDFAMSLDEEETGSTSADGAAIGASSAFRDHPLSMVGKICPDKLWAVAVARRAMTRECCGGH
jgi:hypothetical protein